MKLLLCLNFFCFLQLFCGLKSNAQEIHYIKNETTFSKIKDIDQKEWLPYTETIYKGIDNGIYWFKIKLEPSEHFQIITIQESHITRATLFVNNQETQPLKSTRYVTFKINPIQKETVCYLRVNCLLEARIPIAIADDEQFYKSEKYEFLNIGIYYGIVLCVLLVNLFSYLSTKNATYLHYMFMSFGMAINTVYKDGFFALILGPIGLNEYIEPTVNSIIGISSIYFTASYLQAHRYNPKVHKTGIALIIISQLLNIALLFTQGNFLLYILVDIFVLLALDVFWSLGVFIWKKSFEAKLFTIAYGVPLFVAHGFFLSPYFGFDFLNVPFIWYKVGSVFEMVIFTYAIMHQSKKLANENLEMRNKILEYTNQLNSHDKGINTREATAMELIKQYGFTLKEIEILKDLAEQKTNREIADKHFISQNTVKYHIKNIFLKLEVKNRKAASDKYRNFSGGS